MSDEAPQEPSASQASTPKTRSTPRPRAVQRKTKAEREEYARKEAERAKERQPTETTTTPKTSARGGRGAARGGRGGTKQNERSTVTAGAGVFGAGRGEKPGRSRAPVDLGISEALDGNGSSNLDTTQVTGLDGAESSIVDLGAGVAGSGRVGGGSGGGGGGGGSGGGGRGKVAKQDGDAAIPLDDDIEDVGKRDIERIWISSDEDEDVITSRKGKQRLSSKTPKPGVGLRPVRAARTIVEEDHDEHALKKRVKKTSDDNAVIDIDTDEMQLDEIPEPTRDARSSPELGRKTLRKSDSKIKDQRMLTETVEERAERLRLNEDAEGLRDAFLHKSDTDDTIDSKEEEAVFGRTDHDRMFLFQLPPLIPKLYDPAAKPPQIPEVMEVEQPSIPVKTEPGTAAVQKDGDKSKNTKDGLPQTYTAQSLSSERLAPGLAGKLKIHKSGKVTLDWGGTDMEVRYGTEVDFLQDIVCVENAEEEEVEEGAPKKETIGKAYALGQVHKKMVLIPDWSKLYA